MVTFKDGKIVDSTVCNGGNCERKSRGKPYRMLEWGTPRAAFEHWLDTGMTMNNDNPSPPEYGVKRRLKKSCKTTLAQEAKNML